MDTSDVKFRSVFLFHRKVLFGEVLLYMDVFFFKYYSLKSEGD